MLHLLFSKEFFSEKKKNSFYKMQKQAPVEIHWQCREVSHPTRGVKVSLNLSGQVILKLWIWDKALRQLRWEQQARFLKMWKPGLGNCGSGAGKKGQFWPLKPFPEPEVDASAGVREEMYPGHSCHSPCRTSFGGKAQTSLFSLLLGPHCSQNQKFRRAKSFDTIP